MREMSDSTLGAIRTKVRRLTRSPSIQQLTNSDIDEYVNTFIQYDFPEHLRLFSFRKTFTFVCQPFVDEYQTNDTVSNDQFTGFEDKFISIHDPIYIAGYKSFFSQSREEFFNSYPIHRSINSIGSVGDAFTTAFSGTLSNIPVMQNRVLFDSIGTGNETLALVDVPVVDATGNPTDEGNLYEPGLEPTTSPTVVTPSNTINYVTGVYAIEFGAQGVPASGQAINSQTVPYVPSRPLGLLYYDNVITLRPIPDQPYEINMEVYQRPSELLASNERPDLEQWWQYIALSASKKIFEDRMDMESIQMIMPELKIQEKLVLRKTIVQQTNERTATIYTQQSSSNASYGNCGPNGPF